MQVQLIGVAFLEESKEGAGYPMNSGGELVIPKAINKLGSARQGSGHDCFLKGIRVCADFSATQFEWMQLERYTFFDIVSSQSKMHKLTDMNICACVSRGTTLKAIDNVEECLVLFREKKIDYDELMANVPSGLLLTARCNVNYLSLKTIYNQRKSHRLKGWKPFIEFCDNLPEFKELTGCSL